MENKNKDQVNDHGEDKKTIESNDKQKKKTLKLSLWIGIPIVFLILMLWIMHLIGWKLMNYTFDNNRVESIPSGLAHPGH